MTQPLLTRQGRFVLHVFYRIDRAIWAKAPQSEKRTTREALSEMIEGFREADGCQFECYSVWGHKADLAVFVSGPDLNQINRLENDLVLGFPPGAVQPVHSFTSLTETSEYMTQEDDYDRHLREEEKLEPDSEGYQEKMEAFRKRMRSYSEERLYPTLPDHRVMCFYPMNKLRGETKNWYRLDFEKRKQLMGGHMVTGRKFAGKVKQLVTGSVGLDDWEWGVTLFADDPVYFKQILYEMRFDEVSAVFGVFGEFIVGIRLEPEELFQRIGLR